MRLFVLIVTALSMLAPLSREKPKFERKDKLSDYGFYKGRLADLLPNKGVVPYDVNTPLFSNYAEKLRFVKIPDGEKIGFADSISFAFPVGSVLIKNFFYPNDFRNPAKGRKIIETRLLVHEESGWQAYPYIWNEEQTEAFYDPAGETRTVSFTNSAGKKIKAPYVIPNKNQCKGCHIQGGVMTPIGTNARQLNRNYKFEKVDRNQLQFWMELGLIDHVRTPSLTLARWDEITSGTLDLRARSYLDANCGHCHSRTGPASTSGLFLDIYETNPTHLGVNKPPVAAGRGAGDLQFDISPGDPNRSILVFRMKTNDPAIAMPEIGREQIHQEGVKLIEEWIRKNEF